MGGEIVGLTGDSQANANAAKIAWGVDFPLLADPSCQLAMLFNERAWIVSVIEHPDIESTKKFLNMSFEVGMLQPGAVALRGPVDDVTPADHRDEIVDDRGDDAGWAAITKEPEVLLTWGSVPTAANVNGAVNRLKASDAVAAVRASLAGDLSLARPATDQGKGSRHPMDNPSLPLFYALLMANGNFVKPRPFVMNPDGTGNHMLLIKSAMKKLVVATGAVGFGLFKAPVETAAGLVLYAVWCMRPGGPLKFFKKN